MQENELAEITRIVDEFCKKFKSSDCPEYGNCALCGAKALIADGWHKDELNPDKVTINGAVYKHMGGGNYVCIDTDAKQALEDKSVEDTINKSDWGQEPAVKEVTRAEVQIAEYEKEQATKKEPNTDLEKAIKELFNAYHNMEMAFMAGRQDGGQEPVEPRFDDLVHDIASLLSPKLTKQTFSGMPVNITRDDLGEPDVKSIEAKY